MNRRGLLGIAGGMILSAGCASVVPRSETVVLTRDDSAVAGCKEMAHVQVWLSFSFRDAETQLRNRAIAAGADTVLVTSSFGDSTGTAYRCATPAPTPPSPR